MERLQVFVLPLVGTLVAMCLHGIVFSHRVVGPIYRFRETMRKVRSGDLVGDIRVRKDDYFGDFCDDVNQMIGHLRNDIIQFREASHELAEHGESLAESGHLPPEDQVKLLQLTTASTRLRQLADGYRLEPGEGNPEPDRAVRETAGARA